MAACHKLQGAWVLPMSIAQGLGRKSMFPGPSELIIILLIAVLVFGPKKIPEIMGSLANGIKTFKKSMEGDDTPPPAPSPENVPTVPQSTLSVHTDPLSKEKPGTG